jgi:1-aminocyclopropane-1-carboxylate deaminase
LIEADLHIKTEKAVLQRVMLPGVNTHNKIFIKREDLIHPALSGNKWYKLKYNLIRARSEGYNTLLTFGGAYSNHIYSTASAGELFGFKTIGIIRGEEHIPLNPTLRYAADMGMEIHYISRESYRDRKSEALLNKLKEKFGNVYILPEGGTNSLAVKGTAEVVESIDIQFDYICVPCGTGGTLAGIITGLKNRKEKAIGFSALKGGGFLYDEVRGLLSEQRIDRTKEWKIELDYHFGGYARISKELITFINEFERINGIPLDPIYTGKMMFGIADMCLKGEFEDDSTVIAVHTGGLQGVEGMRERIDALDLKANS